MNTDNLSSHRCQSCASYLEIVFQDAVASFEVCPVCTGAVIFQVPPVVKQTTDDRYAMWRKYWKA